MHAPNWLGDSLMARPFVAGLLAEHRSRAAVVVAHPRVSPVWQAWPGLQVVETRPGPWYADAWRTSRRIKHLGAFQRGYLLSASFRSAATFALAGVPERVGFVAGGRSWMLTEPVRRLPAGRLHYSLEFCRLGSVCPRPEQVPAFVWPAAAKHRAEALLQSGVPAGSDYAVIAVGSAGHAKRYPVLLWRQVIAQIGTHSPVVLVGTSGEATLAGEAAGGCEGVINLCGATGLAELALILQSAAVFAGVDSGAAHLASAVGCPSVVLFGPGDPAETSPQGERLITLRDGLWCSPCRSRICLRPHTPSECMDRISPDAVVSAVLGIRRTTVAG